MVTAKRKREAEEGDGEGLEMEQGVGEVKGGATEDLLIQELLREVRGSAADEDLLEYVENLLERLHSSWKDVGGEELAAQAEGDYLHCVKNGYRIDAVPPTAFQVVGSLALGTGEEISNKISVDVAVVLPDSIFTKKDFLSHRYAGKRALYLAKLVKTMYGVKDLGKGGMRYEFFGNDERKPVVICGVPWSGKTLELRFIPCIGPAAFETHKYHPLRSNIKTPFSTLVRPKNWRKGDRVLTLKNENQERVTPLYTSSIAEDAMLMENHEALAGFVKPAGGALKDAIVLLKIWARKHNLLLEEFGMTGHFFTVLGAWVWKMKEISEHASTLQVFNLLLEGLAALDLAKGESIQNVFEAQTAMKDPPDVADFRKTFESVLVDCTGWVNLAARMPESAALVLKRCAGCTMKLLDSFLPPETKFEKLFLMKPYFGMHFDHHFQVSILKVEGELAKAFGGDFRLWTDQERLVEYIAKLALGNRIVLAHCKARKLKPQAIRKSASTQKLGVKEPELVGGVIDLFLSANSELAHSLVDVGPINTEKELCRNFRSFWGQRAQLRQFKDTSIAEAVIWDAGYKAPHLLMQRSLDEALGKNMKGMEVAMTTRETHFDFLVDSKNFLEEKGNAIKSFDKLSRMLKSIDTLPLKIETLQVASSIYRCTEPMPLKKHKLCGSRNAQENHLYKSFVPVIECFAGLEGSSRWPKNPELQRKTLTAMALHAASTLEKSFGIKCVGTQEYVDVLFDGYVFRLRFHALTGPATLTNHVISTCIKHHTAVSGLATKHAAFSNSVRIAKRWFGSHLLSPHMKQEVVELLVAEAFCNPSCLPTPASHWSGFLRFLNTTASFSWEERPMYVDVMSGELSAVEHEGNVQKLEGEFHAGNNEGKFCVATPYQLDSGYWTNEAAAADVYKNAARAAKSSLAYLDSEMRRGYDGFGGKILRVFTPNLNFYDVLLHLHPESVPLWKYFACISEGNKHGQDGSNGSRAIEDLVHLQTVKSSSDLDARSKLILGENLVTSAVEKIQEVVGKHGFVGYDEFGGTTVALSWNPSCFIPTAKLPDNDVDYVLPVQTGEGKSVYIPNVLALMKEVCGNLRGFLARVTYLS
ncbi:nucleolar protein [Chloropicon primus]|uniref:Nucleolar protein n=3 Tax=Chloropicon primus TaxID=1764295 RepID=A0A5B8MXB7_9CHLO|nr:nucleolar protein [Chloropicon primus]UPR03319.1 nucleolar protein [Chloropicon primus]|eukprot:QDZ24110.1 nucleolar protein [Chloropicon primus]